MKTTLFALILILLFISCEKSENSFKGNAEIIGFNSSKCFCCWGWIIICGKDTIKSDDVKIQEIIGYEIDEPIPVYIELGEIEDACSKMGYDDPDLSIDYYAIKKIELIQK